MDDHAKMPEGFDVLCGFDAQGNVVLQFDNRRETVKVAMNPAGARALAKNLSGLADLVDKDPLRVAGAASDPA